MNRNIEIALARKNNTLDKLYNQYVISEIRKKYSQSEENAILRKKLAGIDSKNEFAEYNTFVEECKRKVKNELGL